MNRKAQMAGLGIILLAFVGILVGVILFQTIAQEVGSATNTVQLSNQSLGTVLDGDIIYLDGYRSLASVAIVTTNGTATNASDYTVTNNVVHPTTGVLTSSVTASPGAVAYKNNTVWNISSVAEPITYVGGAGRSIALLIPIFFALAIAVIALTPSLRSGVLDMLGR